MCELCKNNCVRHASHITSAQHKKKLLILFAKYKTHVLKSDYKYY